MWFGFLMDPRFGIGRSYRDFQSNVVQIRRHSVHAEQAARVRGAARYGGDVADGHAELRRQGEVKLLQVRQPLKRREWVANLIPMRKDHSFGRELGQAAKALLGHVGICGEGGGPARQHSRH